MTSTPRISHQRPQSFTGRPSVPLSVYRELVKELQATQARVESLEAQNQQLVKSNRQLRQEIETVVDQGRRLEKVVKSFERNPIEEPSFVIPVRPRLVTPPSPSLRIKEEIPVTPPITVTASKQPFSKNSWLLVGSIIIVVLTSGLGAFWLISASRNAGSTD
ncbi:MULTISPECIES: bZIP transcription factor [unclassified Microcystis]|jgi:hypothetical protein|uniref:bZIP transcription factor n=1 Tax=unclassified Microcystis TaxID=2643300 RepID=UPI0022CB7D8E|nr:MULTISPECIES: bZIP transcription factor [unclassified Microcystis]MCA2694341.1 hypothetical protein [Microcystis sp. M034S2]MCA2751700.1 hypothetical protein [Microcystis sp. M144S2]MCZ8199162.1 bZIP transcription factor [Microcystis sp. LE19-55.1A]MCZ8305919.1 bZIP transcription factor [Microcystis sp. LE19-98.1E]